MTADEQAIWREMDKILHFQDRAKDARAGSESEGSSFYGEYSDGDEGSPLEGKPNGLQGRSSLNCGLVRGTKLLTARPHSLNMHQNAAAFRSSMPQLTLQSCILNGPRGLLLPP